MNPQDRIPPQSLESEQAALGAMLLERDAITTAMDLITKQDFYREAHRLIFDGMTDLYERKEPVDLITLGEWLQARGALHTIGGTLFLTTCMAQVPTAAGIAHYCTIIREKALRRATIKAADEIMELAYVSIESMHDLLPVCEKKLLTVSDRLKTADGPRKLSAIAQSVFHTYDEAYEQEQAPGFKTGWPGLNGILSPFRPGQLTVIGARPGVGKTAFMLQMGLTFAEQRIAGGVFSLEMDDEELGLRAMLSYMQYDSSQLDDFTFAIPHRDLIMPDLAQGVESVWNLPLFIDDRPSLTVSEMSRTIRRWQREHGKLHYIMVDYAQLATASRRFGTQAECIGDVIYGLHALSKEHDLHVFALSQLNRDVEKLDIKRPQLCHFFGAGQIEAAAYRVLAMYRPEVYGETECMKNGFDWGNFNGMTEINVLKQRGGGLAKTENGRMVTSTWMKYEGGHFRFRDQTPEEWEAFIATRERNT